MKHKLDQYESEVVRRNETAVSSVLGALERVNKLKLGDFLIAFRPRRWTDRREQVVNSYGAPKKYQVVHVDAVGIPYVKELNRSGKPTGTLISPVTISARNGVEVSSEFEFEVDPDYTDSIILSDEENYDAALVQRMKGDLHKEITKHNKSIKVKTSNNQELLKFLQNLKVGDVLWRSTKTNLTITSLLPIPTSHNGTRVKEDDTFGQAVDSKGKNIALTAWYFRYIAIYTGQPRSYNELKDPK